MVVEVKMPQWGMTVTEGTVMKWLKQPGDTVKKGEALCEVEEAKATDVVESPVDGTVTKLCIGEGDTVAVLEPICIIEA